MGNNIRKIRKEKGLTLIQVAEKLGVSESTVQRYESGNIKNLKYETMAALADIFGCSPAYLMGWEEEPKVQISGLDEEYYEDAEIRDIVNLLHKSPEYRILMSASKRLSKKDLELIIEMVERMS